MNKRGALIFAELARLAEPMQKSEVETGLWELVAAGLVTADGFENLRSLIMPRGRTAASKVVGKIAKVRNNRPRHNAGRWTLLHTLDAPSHERMLEATCKLMLPRTSRHKLRRRPPAIDLDSSGVSRTNTSRIRVGLIGYGLAGRVFHAPFISAVPELELAAIVRRNAPASDNDPALAYPGV